MIHCTIIFDTTYITTKTLKVRRNTETQYVNNEIHELLRINLKMTVGLSVKALTEKGKSGGLYAAWGYKKLFKIFLGAHNSQVIRRNPVFCFRRLLSTLTSTNQCFRFRERIRPPDLIN